MMTEHLIIRLKLIEAGKFHSWLKSCQEIQAKLSLIDFNPPQILFLS